MPVITALKAQKNQKRVNVYVDGKFSFGIDLENLLKNNLKVEQEYTKKDLEKLKKSADLQKNINKAIDFALIRPRSLYEVDQWMYRKKIGSFDKKKIIKKLTKLELIGDEQFAKWWIGQRLEFKYKSKKELQYELRKKGVASKIISDVLENADVDDAKAAKKLVQKNIWRWQRYDDQKKKQKMTEFLARKGFGWDTIKSVLD